MTTAVQRQRLDHARRAAIEQRLLADRIPANLVAGWLSAWERRGHGREAADFWERGYAWIDDEVSDGQTPETI